MSIHSPPTNWHVPKHFMKLYSSETVVDNVAPFRPLRPPSPPLGSPLVPLCPPRSPFVPLRPIRPSASPRYVPTPLNTFSRRWPHAVSDLVCSSRLRAFAPMLWAQCVTSHHAKSHHLHLIMFMAGGSGQNGSNSRREAYHLPTFACAKVRGAYSSSVERASGFTLCFVKQSDRQCSVRTCLKSSTSHEHASLRSICTMLIVSVCSGRCVLEAVLTRLCASVRMCIGLASPLMSIHKPLLNWHVPKHFMRE